VYEFDSNLFFFFFYWGGSWEECYRAGLSECCTPKMNKKKKRQLLLLLLLEEISYSFSAGVPHQNDCCWAIRIFPSSIVWPFFALAGGIVTAESRGSCRHHLLLPRQNPKNKSRNCWGGKYQSTFLCDDQFGERKNVIVVAGV
jgi:hypothetical protein